jgi:hypothetical protein
MSYFKKQQCLWVVGFLALAISGNAQNKLDLNKTVTGNTAGEGTFTDYKVAIKSPGVLTLAAYGNNDIALAFLDIDGQLLSGDQGDSDLDGNTGKEVLTQMVTSAGEYIVRVKGVSGNYAEFKLAASLLSFSDFEAPSDPDGRPGLATRINVGSSPGNNSVNTQSGDLVDWYVITPENTGFLIVATRPVNGSEGDLQLEAYYEGAYTEAIATSDQDLQESLATESLNLSVEAGQKIYLRVQHIGEVNCEYRISTAFME